MENNGSEILNSHEQVIFVAPISNFVLNPENTRRYYDPRALSALAVSIGNLGVQVPLRVRMTEVDGFKKLLIISGHRRFLAAQQAGLTELPYVWAEGDATRILHLEAAENLARVDLNPYEELMTVLKVLAHDFGVGIDEAANLLQEIYALQRRMERRSDGDNPMTPEELEEADQQLHRLNMSLMSIGYKLKLVTIVKTRLPLLNWPPELLERMHQGRLNFSNAQLLSTVSAALRSELLDQAEHLSVDELKERIRAAKPAKKPTWEGWREVAKLTKSHPQPPQHVESVLRLALSLANKQPSWHTTRVVQILDVIESGLTPEQEVALEAFLATL